MRTFSEEWDASLFGWSTPPSRVGWTANDVRRMAKRELRCSPKTRQAAKSGFCCKGMNRNEQDNETEPRETQPFGLTATPSFVCVVSRKPIFELLSLTGYQPCL